MYKKLTTACLAVVAIAAFIVPASALAANNPQLTQPTGTVLPSGTKITATNTRETLLLTTTGSTILHCTTASMTGELTANAAGNVKGEITTASFTGTGAGGACTGIFTETVTPEGLPWCLRSDNTMGEDEFQVTGGKCSEAAKKVTFKLTGTASCKYESTTTTVAKGEFTTDTGTTQDAVLSVPRGEALKGTLSGDAGFTKVEGGIACPSTGALNMAFTLEKDAATAEPIYVS